MGFQRFIKALEARYQNWQSKNYEKTKYGRALLKLKDQHRGERCFVIGNGPSLSPEDLQKLHENGIACFATNRIYKMFDRTDWRPTYYVSEDVNVLRGVQKEASQVPAEIKFIPVNLRWYEGIDIPGATYFYMEYKDELKETFGLSIDVPHCVRCRGTVTTTCIQLAAYLGFSEIYLLGVDHSFSKMVDKNGNVIEDKSIKSHFIENYNSDIPDLGFHVDEATDAYISAEKLSHKLKTFHIYNATRGGKLEVFERVNFDSMY